VSTLMPPS
jgi:hypothetical protein